MVIIIILIIIVIAILWQYFRQYRLANNTVIAFTGTMGSGKTYLAVREAMRSYRKQKLSNTLGRFILPYRFINPTWNRKAIIYSNIPIQLKKGKYSEVLTNDIILRKKLLPEGAIVLIDEIGQFASQWDYENPYVKEELADLTRFFRHWVDGRMYITDQSSDNIVKAVRSRLGMIYNLNDFHRWLMLPFFKCSVTPLLCVEDTNTNLTDNLEQERKYFFGILNYKWFSKFFKLNHYNSRCYSPIYEKGALKHCDSYDKTLKTRYLMDISVSSAISKDYKTNRDKYKEKLYTPYDKLQ